MQAALLQPSAGAPLQSLTNNWRAILATDCPDKLKYVRVEDGVALITNKKIAIRAPVEAPDGFYVLNAQNNLVPVPYPYWGEYPDPDSFYVDFGSLSCSLPISKELCTDFIQWLEFARREKEIVYADKVGFFTHNKRLMYDLAHFLNQELPFSDDETMLDPYYLKLAFTEMLRYDQSYLCKNVTDKTRQTPLIVGNNWAQCAMVMPMRRGY